MLLSLFLSVAVTAFAETPPPYPVLGARYEIDLPIDGKFTGRTDQGESCFLSVREGQSLAEIYGKPGSSFAGLVVPEGVLIDSYLKRRALVFVVDFHPAREGAGGLMTPHSRSTPDETLDADFLRTNNRLIFAALPDASGSSAIHALHGPGLCGGLGSSDAKNLPHVTWNSVSSTLVVRCGDPTTATFTELELNLKHTQKNKVPVSFRYRIELGSAQSSRSGLYRSSRNRDVIGDVQCRELRKAPGF